VRLSGTQIITDLDFGSTFGTFESPRNLLRNYWVRNGGICPEIIGARISAPIGGTTADICLARLQPCVAMPSLSGVVEADETYRGGKDANRLDFP
jgi:hypothetical protein